MEDLFFKKIEAVASQKEAIDYLQELSEAIPNLCIEHFDIADYVSAISGFLEHFQESDSMKPEDFQKLCTIIYASLFYE